MVLPSRITAEQVPDLVMICQMENSLLVEFLARREEDDGTHFKLEIRVFGRSDKEQGAQVSRVSEKPATSENTLPS